MYSNLWYKNLIQPPLTPIPEVFGFVWPVLYILIFISLAFYILKPKFNKEVGYFYFIVQFVLNIIWAPIFFRAQNILLALIVLILLDIFAFLTIRKFFMVSKISGFLFVPYFLWILFATYLNIGYLILN